MMEMRGMKMWAVMAMKPGWSKPRFVHDSGRDQFHIFTTKKLAENHAELLVGQTFHCDGKDHEVEWLALPVWTETMPFILGSAGARCAPKVLR